MNHMCGPRCDEYRRQLAKIHDIAFGPVISMAVVVGGSHIDVDDSRVVFLKLVDQVRADESRPAGDNVDVSSVSRHG